MGMALFETKVRQVGTSLGVLLPGNIVEANKLSRGEIVQITILKKDHKLIDKLFGSATGVKPYKRDRNDRVL
ncbi:MAG: hypothetical protein HY544_05425 [Candidatus Diapherotrites archaeon]|uniref:AbrB/MazE/SpoVT family DNA-binding domain-containing protein n=1 Tax=Candidatus Iainarchaeum sp. TaxID=3101447 RepID=A0A8T3YMA3_9ARCH|nr:hypothetical protein [Candidatus Diapherotrites archaeon]